MKCPKCGGVQIVSDYISAVNQIERRCAECSYTERQLPLDHNEAEDKADDKDSNAEAKIAEKLKEKI